MTKRDLAFDTEANGLLEDVTKVWCVVAEDIETREMFIFHDFPQFNGAEVFDPFDNETFVIPKRNGTLAEGITFLQDAGGKLIAHNTLGYDHFLMKRFFPDYKVKLSRYHDTFIQSKLQWFDRPTPKGCKGPHGLEAWGARQGIRKPSVSDWTVMDAFKLHRCIQDVRIQTDTYFALEKERSQLEKMTGKSISEAMMVDHKYRFEATLQELRGTPVDVPHMKECVVELDELMVELQAKIEPRLPPTVKFKATKETANYVATELGSKRIPPIRYEFRKRKGESVRFPIKDYYKPVTKFTTTEKGKVYKVRAKDDSVETDYIFSKLKDARQWVKDNYSDSKLKWAYPSIEKNTTRYNSHTCNWFDVEPDDFFLRKDLQIIGPHTKVEFLKSTMSQHAIVKAFLVSLGWVPTEWNLKKDDKGQVMRAEKRTEHRWPPKASPQNQVVVSIPAGQALLGAPKLTEDSYESIEGEGVGLDIAHYNTYSHRRKFIQNPTDTTKGLLNRVREDHRVPCGINSFGTATGRS